MAWNGWDYRKLPNFNTYFKGQTLLNINILKPNFSISMIAQIGTEIEGNKNKTYTQSSENVC